jgi:hypothetical protein
MHDLDSAAGATPVMPMNRAESFAVPSGGRRRGRPKGSRSKARLALEAVLEESAEALMRVLIARASAGEWAALRFCVGLVLPPRRDRPVVFELPEIESAGGLVKAARAILAACAAGSLSPDEAKEVMNLITAVRAIEKMGDHEARLIELERRQRACAASASRSEAAPCERRPPARRASRRRKAFGASAGEIEKATPTPRRAACKSPVFNSFAAPPAGHRMVPEIFSILGERGAAAVTAASPRVIRGPPPIRWSRGPPMHSSANSLRIAAKGFTECSDEVDRGFELEGQAARPCARGGK